MASYVPSTVRLRRLGAELRKLREDLGWTLATASRMVDRAPSSLGKIERGDVAVRVDAVDYILRKYGVTDQRLHRALLTLPRRPQERLVAALRHTARSRCEGPPQPGGGRH